jgi:hypothetical protein
MSTAAAAVNASGFSAPKTPYDVYFERRENWLNQPENRHILGSILIQGIPSSNDDDSEEEDLTNSQLTAEQMNSLRFIMATPNREAQYESMGKLILEDQYGESFMMFNTSYSNHVLGTWYHIKPKLGRMTPDKKFDSLLAYTRVLLRHDVWMHDNEGDMGTLVKGLATVWRNLLKKSDEEIGWDVEYTKPGVYSLLRQFKEAVEGMDDMYEMGKFKYE